MTFLKNKPLLAIIAVGVAVALTGVVFSAQVFAHGQESFEGSGYILQVLDGQTGDDADSAEGQEDRETVAPLVTPAAFDADGSYRYRFPDTVQFTDAEGNKTSVSQASFVHYDDNSVASFVKTVFVDLDHVGDAVVYYYDLPARRTMEFKGGSWRLDNGGAELAFSHVLLKLDESHYLILSDDITFSVNGATQMNFQGAGSYLEVEYIEGGIVRFSNEQGSYQTIASDATVTVGNGVAVNFGDKLVSTEDGAKLSLDQMVIDADDNIEISPEAAAALSGEDEQGEEGAEGSASADGGAAGATTVVGGGSASASGGAGGSSSSSSGAIAGGAGNGTQGDAGADGDDGASGEDGSDGEDSGDVLEDANDSRKTPSFSISDGSTSPVGFNANISIADEENMLTSGATVTIVDRETGKVVYESSVAAGVLDFDISAAGLDPDKEYVLSATATYKDGDQEYTKSFLDKVFKTDPVGIMMNKAYAATDTLGVNVQVGAYANVVNAKLRLLDDQGETVETKDVDVSGARIEGGVDVAFENLSPNSVYAAELCDVTYSNVTVESFGDALALKTLRRAPELPVPVSTSNRRAMQFTLELPEADIKDPDAGITGYTWEVYRHEDVQMGANGEPVFQNGPVWTANPASGTKVTLPVDNITIMSGDLYVARALVSFDDNEKAVTYDTALTSPPFGMDGVAFPTVRLVDEAVTFESYKGTLYIDNAQAIKTGSKAYVVYSDGLNESFTEVVNIDDNNASSIEIPLDKTNLRSGTTYTVSLYATYNLWDNNDQDDDVFGYIGAGSFKTPLPDTIHASWGRGVSSSVPFVVELNLGAMDAAGDIELEMRTMSLITLTLREGGQTGAEVGACKLTGGTNLDNPYGSTLFDRLYKGTEELTPEDFGVPDEKIKPNTTYTITIDSAVDYTQNMVEPNGSPNVPNNLPVDGASFGLTTSKTWPALPKDPTTGVTAEPITNGVAPEYGVAADGALAPETVRGYRLTANFDNGNQIAREVTFYVVDACHADGQVLAQHTEEVPADGSVPKWQFTFGEGDAENLTRGHKYRFNYTMKIELEDAPQEGELIYPECAKEGYVLTSATFDAPYEKPELSMYLEGAKDIDKKSNVVWKWTSNDPDGVLSADREGKSVAYFRYTGGSTGNKKLAFDDADEWNTVTFPYTAGRWYTLDLYHNLYAHDDLAMTTTNLVTHFVDAPRSWRTEATDTAEADFTGVSHELKSEKGVLEIAVDAAPAMPRDMLKAVASLEVTLTDASNLKNKKTVFVTPEIQDTGGVRRLLGTISLKDIKDLLGSTLKVSARVVYDNGRFGVTDANGDALKKGTLIAFQELSSGATKGAGKYIVVDSSSTPKPVDDLVGGGLKLADATFPAFAADKAFAQDGSSIVSAALSALGGAGVSAKMSTSENGIVLYGAGGAVAAGPVAVKRLSHTAGAALEADDTFDFKAINPIVKMHEINIGVDRAQITFTPELVGMVAQDDTLKIAVERRPRDAAGNVQFESWKTFTYEGAFKHNKKTTLSIPKDIDTDESVGGLDPSYEYQFRLFIDAKIANKPGAEVQDDTPVIDKDEGKAIAYALRLYNNVPVSVDNMVIKVDPNDDPYAKKFLEVQYGLDNHDATVTVALEVFEADEDGNRSGDALLTETKQVSSVSDSFSVEYEPGGEIAKKIVPGKKYVVSVSCYTSKIGEGGKRFLLGEDEKLVTLKKLGKPIASITATPEFKEVTEETQRQANDAVGKLAQERAERLAAEAAAALESQAAEQVDGTAKGDADPDGNVSAGDGTPAASAAGAAAISADGDRGEDGDSSSDSVDAANAADSQLPTSVRNQYNLTFNVSVFDNYGSLAHGEYMIRFFDKAGRQITEDHFAQGGDAYTDPQKISEVNKAFRLVDLDPGSNYTVKVYGVLDEKNEGGKPHIKDVIDEDRNDPDKYLIASGTGKTTPQSGVDVGMVQLVQSASNPKQFTMNFYNAIGLDKISEIQFSLYSPQQMVANKTMPFEEKTVSSNYHAFEPEVDLPASGMYTMQVSYLAADGTLLASGTYEYVHAYNGTGV